MSMTINETKHDVTRKPGGVLGWSIAASILGFWPLGIVAIVKAIKSRKHWQNGEYEKACSVMRTADILSLTTIMVGLAIMTIGCLVLNVYSIINTSLPFVITLILWWFGLAGMNEGQNRICGLSGGFILGMIPVLGMIIISNLLIKDQKQEIVSKNSASGILGWSIAATLLGFWPLGIIAIIKANESKKLWHKGECVLANEKARTADILSLVSVVVGFLVYVLIALLVGVVVGDSAIIIALLILVLSGFIGMLEGMHRTCGLAGGFILGMFPIIGWIMVSSFSWKGEDADAWMKQKSQYV